MASARSDETAIKKMWKILSTNGTMDKMRKDLHEDPEFKEWQETVNIELQRIIESDDTQSYEKIIPVASVTGIFLVDTDRTMCPGVNSAWDSPGGKGGRCVRLTTYHPCGAERQEIRGL